jgi:hypothetical protein
VIGGPFPFEWVTSPPGSGPDAWSWPGESLGPVADGPDDAPDVSWLAEVPDDAPEALWLAEEPDPDPVESLVGDEGVVVVDGLAAESGDEGPVVGVAAAVVVESPEEGGVVEAEPSSRAEAAGAAVGPAGEAGAPASGALGGPNATGFTEEDGTAFEDGSVVLAATIGGAPAGAAAPAGCAQGWVAPARGPATPDTGG